jgi:hypothetical protein
MVLKPTMHAPLRIAVLECDEPIGATKEKYGGYGNLFKELLINGAKELAHKDGGREVELDVRKYDIVNQEVYPELDGLDAVLITGSSECSHPPSRRIWRKETLMG